MDDPISIRPSCGEDGLRLARVLRKEDRREITLRYGNEPELVLPMMIASKHSKLAFTIHWNSKPHGMFGVDEVSPFVGCPWFLSSSELITNFRRRFIRESKDWLSMLSQDFNVLENYISSENAVHIRWVKSMGFEVLSEGFRVESTPFWKIRKLLNSVKTTT